MQHIYIEALRCSPHLDQHVPLIDQGMTTARIQPLSAAQLHHSAAGAGDQDQKQAVYTVWMKSLVFNGHSCTIYGQDGRVAYRVDNYACTRRREVFIMDTAGKALIKLQLKKVHIACCSPDTI